MEKRYEKESFTIGKLALGALNKKKNRQKCDFEDMFLSEIIEKLDEEVTELKDELTKTDINKERVFDELGDCAAVLAGVYAWIEGN